MPDAKSEVQIIISGSAVGLSDALKQAQAGLSSLGAAATKAGAEAGEHLAAGEHKAASEATILGERARVAAEMVGLLGAESSEQILKIEGLNHAFGEAQHAFSGFGGALAATAGSFALFKGLDFMKESVDEAEQGEASWARLTAAYKDNAEGLEQVKGAIEEQQPTWEKLGLTQAQVAEMAAKAAGMGLDPTKLLGDPAALADTAKVLGTDIPTALEDIARPRGAQQVLGRLGLSPVQIREAVARMRDMNAQQRAIFLEQQVEQSRFAGQGLAAAGTAQGTFLAFHTAMADLREEVGNALLPALTQLATALTGLLQSAEKAAQPFGGLANVLKTLFLPMLGLGLLLFTNLRGMMTGLVNLLLGRLVGSFAQTAESIAAADAEARTLASDVEAIPETWTTTAVFIPDAAKERWIANIESIPRGPIVTTGEFVPETISEPAAAGITVPMAVAAPAEAEVAGAVAEAERIVTARPLVEAITLAAPSSAALSREAASINARMAHALTLHETVPITVVDHVTERIPGILSRARAQLAGAHLVANVGAAATLTAGFEVANAIFNNAKFNQPDLSHLPAKATFSAADAAQLAALNKKLSQPLHVHVDGGTVTANLGSLGGALVGTTLSPDDKTLLRQQIAALQAQKKAADAYAAALADAKKHPLPVQVHFDAAEMAKMVGEVALGTLLGNLFAKVLDPGRILGLLKAGGANLAQMLLGGGSESEEAAAINKMMNASGLAGEDAVAAAQKYFKTPGAPTPGAPAEPTVPTEPVEPLPMVPTGGMAMWMWGAVPLKDKHGHFTGKTRPSTPQEDIAANKALGKNIQALGTWIVGEIATGGKANSKQAQTIGALVIDAIVDGVKSHWPAWLPYPFGGHGPGKGYEYAGGSYVSQYVPYKAGSSAPGAPAGWQYILEQHKSDHKMWYDLVQKAAGGGSGAGKFGGLARIDPALLAQAGALIGASGPGARAQATAHHTYNATFNIHGATDANAVARQVNRAFSEFVQGARAQRRLHG